MCVGVSFSNSSRLGITTATLKLKNRHEYNPLSETKRDYKLAKVKLLLKIKKKILQEKENSI